MRYPILAFLWFIALIAYVQRAAISVPLKEIGRDFSLTDAVRQKTWRWERHTVDLLYRSDLPTVEETLRELASVESRERAARAAGDTALGATAMPGSNR